MSKKFAYYLIMPDNEEFKNDPEPKDQNGTHLSYTFYDNLVRPNNFYIKSGDYSLDDINHILDGLFNKDIYADYKENWYDAIYAYAKVAKSISSPQLRSSKVRIIYQ